MSVDVSVPLHETDRDVRAGRAVFDVVGNEHLHKIAVVHDVQIWTHSDLESGVPARVDPELPHGHEVKVSEAC